MQERFQNSTNEKDVGEGAEEIVCAAAADIFRPLHALGLIVISNAMQTFRSKQLLLHFPLVSDIKIHTISDNFPSSTACKNSNEA